MNNRYLWLFAVILLFTRLTVLKVDFAIRTDSIYAFITEYFLKGKWLPLYGGLTQIGSLIFDVEKVARVISALSGGLLIFPVVQLNRILWRNGFEKTTFAVLLVQPMIFRYANLPLNDMLFCLLFMLAIAHFTKHGIWFVMFSILSLSTRPEALILTPLLFSHCALNKKHITIIFSGLLMFVVWIFFRSEIFQLVGIDLGHLFRAALIYESVEGLGRDGFNSLWFFLSTLCGVLILSWPVILLLREKIRFQLKNKSMAIFLLLLCLIIIIGTSGTPQWSGRRLLLPTIICLPLCIGIIARNQLILIAWMVPCITISTMAFFYGGQEYEATKSASLFASEQNKPIVTNDMRRVEWWSGKPCTQYVSTSALDKEKIYVISELKLSERPIENRVFKEKWINLFFDGRWKLDGEVYSNTVPNFRAWFKFQEFETIVY